MPGGSMTDAYWTTLLRNIQNGKCTPFIGAGASAGTLEVGAEVARRWADAHRYPLADVHDLARVAQFVAIQHGEPLFPKQQIAGEFAVKGTPDFNAVDEPHGLLANLPLPIYITTNYDPFMFDALSAVGRTPTREYCRWNPDPHSTEIPSVFDRAAGFEPTVDRPLVFHLHGHVAVPESMVLTEDDYVDFLVNIKAVPERIRMAMAHTSLMFLGFSLRDWDFRVLYRGLVAKVPPSRKRLSLTVQIDDATDASREAIREYLDRYFDWMDVIVYWGSAREFTGELRRRWDTYRRGA